MQADLTLLLRKARFLVFFALIVVPILPAFAQTSSFMQSGQKPEPSLSSRCNQPVLPSAASRGLSNSIGIIAQGKISSVLDLAGGLKYVASGDWNMSTDGTNGNFLADMTWYPTQAQNNTVAKTHTHAYQVEKFLPGQQIRTTQPGIDISIPACANIFTNGKLTYPDIPILITIKGQTIDIKMTGTDQYSVLAENHFAGNKDIMGVADSVQECSNMPQDNMVILAECNPNSAGIESTTNGNFQGGNGGLLPFIPVQ